MIPVVALGQSQPCRRPGPCGSRRQGAGAQDARRAQSVAHKAPEAPQHCMPSDAEGRQCMRHARRVATGLRRAAGCPSPTLLLIPATRHGRRTKMRTFSQLCKGAPNDAADHAATPGMLRHGPAPSGASPPRSTQRTKCPAPFIGWVAARLHIRGVRSERLDRAPPPSVSPPQGRARKGQKTSGDVPVPSLHKANAPILRGRQSRSYDTVFVRAPPASHSAAPPDLRGMAGALLAEPHTMGKDTDGGTHGLKGKRGPKGSPSGWPNRGSGGGQTRRGDFRHGRG